MLVKLLLYAGEEQRGKNGLAVFYFSGVNFVQQGGERYVQEFDLFVGLWLRDAGVDVFGEKDVEVLRQEAGRGEVTHEARPLAGAEAGFFNELALGGGQGLFLRFDAAGGKLEQELAGGVAVLAFDEDGRVVRILGTVDGKDDDGAIVPDDVAGAGDAAGLGDGIGDDGEDLALEGDFGLQDGGFPGRFRGGFVGGFFWRFGGHGAKVPLGGARGGVGCGLCVGW